MPGICFEMLPHLSVREFFVQSACLAAGIVRGGPDCRGVVGAAGVEWRLSPAGACILREKERILTDALFGALPENPGQAFFEWALIAPIRNTR